MKTTVSGYKYIATIVFFLCIFNEWCLPIIKCYGIYILLLNDVLILPIFINLLYNSHRPHYCINITCHMLRKCYQLFNFGMYGSDMGTHIHFIRSSLNKMWTVSNICVKGQGHLLVLWCSVPLFFVNKDSFTGGLLCRNSLGSCIVYLIYYYLEMSWILYIHV